MKAFIGIDPGINGGISWIVDGDMMTSKMPDSEKGVIDLLFEIRECCDSCVARLEQVHSMPGQGVSSSFKFGMGFGGLKMALAAWEIPYELVPPQKWQKHLGCLTGGNKNITKAFAQALFPTIRVTHAIADSMLIAEYCRRTSM